MLKHSNYTITMKGEKAVKSIKTDDFELIKSSSSKLGLKDAKTIAGLTKAELKAGFSSLKADENDEIKINKVTYILKSGGDIKALKDSSVVTFDDQVILSPSASSSLTNGAIKSAEFTLAQLKAFTLAQSNPEKFANLSIKLIDQNPLTRTDLKFVETFKDKLANESINKVVLTTNEINEFIASGLISKFANKAIKVSNNDPVTHEALQQFKKFESKFEDFSKISSTPAETLKTEFTVQEFLSLTDDNLYKLPFNKVTLKDNDINPIIINYTDYSNLGLRFESILYRLKDGEIKNLKTDHYYVVQRLLDDNFISKFANNSITISEPMNMHSDWHIVKENMNKIAENGIPKIILYEITSDSLDDAFAFLTSNLSKIKNKAIDIINMNRKITGNIDKIISNLDKIEKIVTYDNIKLSLSQYDQIKDKIFTPDDFSNPNVNILNITSGVKSSSNADDFKKILDEKIESFTIEFADNQRIIDINSIDNAESIVKIIQKANFGPDVYGFKITNPADFFNIKSNHNTYNNKIAAVAFNDGENVFSLDGINNLYFTMNDNTTIVIPSNNTTVILKANSFQEFEKNGRYDISGLEKLASMYLKLVDSKNPTKKLF